MSIQKTDFYAWNVSDVSTTAVCFNICTEKRIPSCERWRGKIGTENDPEQLETDDTEMTRWSNWQYHYVNKC